MIKIGLIAIAFITAVGLARIIIPYIMLVTYRKRLFDPVDGRKLHTAIIPRLGGVSFVPIQCFLMALIMVVVYKVNFVNLEINTTEIFPMFLILICGLFVLFMVGIADDLLGMNYRWKFLAQVFVAALLPLSGLWINDLYGLLFITTWSPWLGIPLTIFITVLIINAVNLMDGLDGLCSGSVGVGALVLGSLFIYYGAWIHALFAFITAGIVLVFFYFNVFGASKRHRRIFMGDTGSMTLGYSIAFLAISFSMNNPNIKPFSEGAIVVGFSTLIVPVLDVLRVMYVRWRIKMPLFKPDRNHLHHKFLRTGMSHARAMISILLLSLFFCFFNIISVQFLSNNIVVLLDILLWVGFHALFNLIEKSKLKKKIFFPNI